VKEDPPREELSHDKRCCAISVDVTKLDSQAELKSVDEQADNEIVHRSGFRKTDSSSHQSFDARA
jgi:hypothetical protein